MIVASGSCFTDEIRHAPEEHLSHHDGFVEVCNLSRHLGTMKTDDQQMFDMDITVGPETYDPFHVEVVRNSLTKNIWEKFSELHAELYDEIATAFGDYIPTDIASGMSLSILECFDILS